MKAGTLETQASETVKKASQAESIVKIMHEAIILPPYAPILLAAAESEISGKSSAAYKTPTASQN